MDRSELEQQKRSDCRIVAIMSAWPQVRSSRISKSKWDAESHLDTGEGSCRHGSAMVGVLVLLVRSCWSVVDDTGGADVCDLLRRLFWSSIVQISPHVVVKPQFFVCEGAVE